MILVIVLSGCQELSCGRSPEALIVKMETLVKEVEGLNYSLKSGKWEKYDDRFRLYYEECYDYWEPGMKGKEKREFAKWMGRYVAIRYGSSLFKKIFEGKKTEDEDGIPNQLKIFLQDFKDLLGREINFQDFQSVRENT